MILLHDVDDYKLFGEKNASELTNAKLFMDNAYVDEEIKKQVLDSIKTIGYSKSLKGVRPNTLEGMIVSDADMCDALGVTGVLRVYQYSLKNGRPFFDKNIFPITDMTFDKYVSKRLDTSVCHMFEKILKLKDLMMTESGKKEAIERHNIIVEILYHLFDEEDAAYWVEYLNDYLKKNN